MENSEILHVNILDKGNITTINGFPRTYKNLMSFLSINLSLEDMGECKGMGRCGTCKIRIENNSSLIGDYDGNELNTLKMLGNNDPNVRLSCKIYLNERTDNLLLSVI